MQENSGAMLSMVFYGFLFILFAITAVVIFVSLRRGGDREEIKPQHQHYKTDPLYAPPPAVMDTEEKEEYQGKIIQLENTLKYREDEYKRRISALEIKLQEKEKLAGTAAIPKDEIAKKFESLQKEHAKLSEELTLKSQMYEGLKGQYDELEKDMQRMIEHLEGLKKFPSEAKPQTSPPPPRPTV
jgi:DNA repair exonuclease SbcCD ATPase subunit